MSRELVVVTVFEIDTEMEKSMMETPKLVRNKVFQTHHV